MSRRKAVTFRVLAVLISLSPLLILEAGLRLGGYHGRDTAAVDPFVDFQSVRPLFEPSEDGQRSIPKSRQEFFRPEQFFADKPPRQYRIFCLGGSTVQGRPFAIETAFTTWLELSLNAAEPDRPWRVVNCGGVSYASYRLTPILREVLSYDPDLIILYTGQNEFLEERSYATLKQQPEWLRKTARSLDSVRSFRLARSYLRSKESRETLATEVDAMLDYRGGLEQYKRDDDWTSRVMDHYQQNVRRMIRLVKQNDVPMLVCNPVSNLSNSPPIKVQPGSLSATDARQFQVHWDAASPQRGKSLQQRIEQLTAAVTLDRRHAGAHYQLAKSLQAAGRHDEARNHFLIAKDEDVCPLRMLEPMHESLRRAVSELGAHWVDVRGRFEAISPGRTVGEKWLVDHVHPSIHGHQQIAEWLFDELVADSVIAVQPGYVARRDSAFQNHLESLPPLYYEGAKRRLEGLQRWSEGRAFKVHIP